MIENKIDTMTTGTSSKIAALYKVANDSLQDLCKPLFETTAINHVYYNRCLINRTTIPIMTDEKFLHFYLENCYYNTLLGHLDFNQIKTGYYNPVALFRTQLTEHLIQKVAETFSTYNGFLIINKFADYCDSFYISFAEDSQHNVNFCINNSARLNIFFKNIAPMIDDLCSSLPVLSVDYKQKTIDDGFSQAHAESFLSQTFPALEPNTLLSKREKIILYQCIQGKTAKQIADSIGLSFRTVQNNIERIKDKYSCQSISHLLSMFIDPEKVPS